MKSRNEQNALGRRSFVTAIAAGTAGSLLVGQSVSAAQTQPPTPAGSTNTVSPAATLPNATTIAAETAAPPQAELVLRSGSDFMVDVIKSLSISYVAAMPGSTFRGLHESIIDYGGNIHPELLTCLHEEASAAMAHGYAKVANRPMAVMMHGVVGLQHGSMGIYNAWADRAPMLIFVGNTLEASERRPGVEWTHSAQDNAAMVRDYTKWDDMPLSLGAFADSTARAWQLTVTAPTAPTLIVVDGGLAEHAADDTTPAPASPAQPSNPVGDPHAVMEAARMLAAASHPVILVDRLVRTKDGMDMLVALAEALAAPVIDRGGRMNMPTAHPLNHSENSVATLRQADVVIGLEMADLYGAVNRYRDVIHRDSHLLLPPGTKLIDLGAHNLLIRANLQDFGRYQPATLSILGDGEATLPSLLDAVRQVVPRQMPNAYADRNRMLRASFITSQARDEQNARYAWNASPIATARLSAELWAQIQKHDWALLSPVEFQSNWPKRLWNFSRPYQYIGGAGGYGVGYAGPAAIGGALAHRDVGGRLPVAIIGDGELMCAPHCLWTAAHHRIPVLIVMHNNRAYHQEVMHIQTMANRHARGIDRAGIGTTITGPDIDFAKMADSMGIWAKGPIHDPDALAPAITEAIAMVQSGTPALLDIVCQPR